MESIEELQQLLQQVEEEIEEHRRRLSSKKKELLKIEDGLLEARERAYKLVADLQMLKEANDFSSLIDQHREQEIADFKLRAPDLLRKLSYSYPIDPFKKNE